MSKNIKMGKRIKKKEKKREKKKRKNDIRLSFDF